MATLTIRNFDPTLKERLRIRAAKQGRSMEAEVQSILQVALGAAEPATERSLYDRIRDRFAPFGGIDDLVIPPRDLTPEPPSFD